MTRVVKNPSGYVSHGRTAAEKADNFGKYAKSHGWQGKWSAKEEPHVVHLFCRRGESETIDIWWHANGSLILDRLPVYTLAGEKIKLRNVSAAAKVVAAEPDMSRLRKATRKQRRQMNGDGPVKLSEDEISDYIAGMQGSLPFDHESTDEELKAVLKGRTVTWVNRFSGQLNSAVVSDNPKQFKVIREPKPQVHFVYPVQRRTMIDTFGFRAVYLDSIVSVG